MIRVADLLEGTEGQDLARVLSAMAALCLAGRALRVCVAEGGTRARLVIDPAPPRPAPALPPSCRHSADFRCVVWCGVEYVFTPTQAAVVRQLWEAADEGTPSVGQATLLEGAGSDC